MLAFLHHAQDIGELLEVELLRGSEWAYFEERDNPCHEVGAPLHGEAEQRLAMVVPSRVLDHPATPEHLDEVLESSPRAGRLRHVVLRTTEIEKHPSPSTKPTAHSSAPGLSC
jgi:hypothetical protein